MIIIRYIATCLFFSVVFADYAGGYPGAISRNPVSAREISLSNSMVSTYNKGFSAFTNPSLVAHTKGIEIGSSLFSLPSNISMQVFSISRRLPPQAGAGLSVVRLGANNLTGISSDEELTGSLKHNDYYVMMSFGLNFGQYLSVGVNGKALFQRSSISSSETISSDGISLDAGIFSSPLDYLDVGIRIENISGKYKTDQDEVEIPMRFISGISYSPNISTTLLFQHELINLNGEYLTHRSSFGLEYELDYDFPIFLRFGLKQNRWGIINKEEVENLYVFTGGFGIQFNYLDKSTINLDYGIVFNEIGINNVISLSANL